MSFDPALTQGRQAPALQGRHSPQSGLAALLAGSGLQAEQQADGSFTLRRAPAPTRAAGASVQTLPAVTVQAAPETATGPVFGYRARRAVTATKTDTPLAETPQSVTVVTRDQMTEQGMTNVQDALTYAAGVRSDLYGLDSRNDGMAVRGANPVNYLDGLRGNYNWYTSTIRFDPYTLERVEVLRGPAGMLFGAGSVGGVMNMVGKRPLFEPQREVGVQLGSFNRRQAQLDLTGPINEQLAYRLVTLARKSDTQVDHVRDDRALLMPSLTWRPNAATSLTLHALWQRDKSGNTAQFFPLAGTLFPAVPGYLPTSRFIGEPSDFYNTRHTHVGWRFEHAFNAQWALRQNFRHSRNANDARYFWADYETIPGGWGADPINQRLLRRVLSDSRTRTRMTLADTHVQGQFSAGGAQHTVLAGLDVIRFKESVWESDGDESLIDAWNPVYGQFSPSGNYVAYPVAHQHQLGFYAQDQIKWGPWAFTAGLRRDRARSGAQGSDAVKTSATTGRLAAMYLGPQHWNPYISYTESFLPQAPRQGQNFKPLKGKQWELGVKYEPPGQTMAFNAAIYDLREVNRIQQPRPNEYNQLGQTRTRGLELETRGQLGRRFELLAHYNYIDLDKQLEGLPKHQASVWGKYRFGDARQGWSAGAGLRWASAFRDGSGPRVPSSALLDLMLAYDNGPWRLALNVQNAADKVYFAACLERGDCWWGARRNVLLTLDYRF
ncbi:TonB-dependent siderophore receptor [Vandammella animalimorsus]|uniref:TonB-dependent siderophore receptor n=1 Tax=Vandammella animalimorsus TaxID=2029117 RepID=A0A2A2TAA2_9BURK|nr:TonB-dependent siderophore receptor [Vandammella animalimorsus]PAX20968.1 TonB-dependent siderophore receptor [Vandammella animalimorsus]